MSEIGAKPRTKGLSKAPLAARLFKIPRRFTEKTRVPTRLSIFELAESALDVPDIDQVLAIEDVVGAASIAYWFSRLDSRQVRLGTSPSTLKKPRL